MTLTRPIARRSFCGGFAAAAALPLAAERGAMAESPPQRDGQAGSLEVPGARLHYETQGSGPVLIMVAGAAGTGDPFRMVASHLAAHYTVVIYDRRGFSRSRLTGPQDYDQRLKTEADDARRLVEHLSRGPATVFGTSSGAIIALDVLARHPSVVRTLIAYEPAAVRQLPDGQKWVDFFAEVYDLYRRSGIEAALKTFRERAFAETDRQTMARAPKTEFTLPNATHWFEHELRQYPAVRLDLAALKAHADRIVLMSWRESRGYPAYQVNLELGKKLSRDVIEMPGGHVGFLAHPAEFARALVEALVRIGHGPKR